MIYRGEFADIYDVQYRVDFDTKDGNSSVVELTLGETPCVITTQSEGLFDPIKPSTCTIQVVTTEFIPDLYSSTPQGVEVKVYNQTEDYIEFHGYVTPCVYNQGYTYIDTLEIECIDALSSLQYYEFTCESSNNPSNVTAISILKRACQKAGYDGSMNYINTFQGINLNSYLYISESNFFDDDDEKTAWKWYDVVEEICKFLGWSAIPYRDSVYFTDYRYLGLRSDDSQNHYPWTYQSINLTNSNSISMYAAGWLTSWVYDITLPLAAGSPEISLDEVYNKISITANTYDIEGIHQLDDNKYYKSINKEQNIINNISIPDNINTHKYGGFLGLWRKTSTGGYPPYAGAYSRITSDSGWNHHWYRSSPFLNMTDPTKAVTFTEIFGEYPYLFASGLSGNTAGYVNGFNGAINTIGAAFCKYVVGDDYSKASSCIMFLKLYDENTYPYYTCYELDDKVPHVLNYESKEDIIFQPASGTTWITIGANLLWQKNTTKNNSELLIVDETNKNYVTVPFEGDIKLGSGNNETTFSSVRYPMNEKRTYSQWSSSANNTYTTEDHCREANESSHGLGFQMWKIQVNIGNYWWNGFTQTWQTYSGSISGAPYFYISYNNSPSSSDREEILTQVWMDIVPNNSTYYSSTGKKKYAIPIPANSGNSAPSHGKIKIYVYPPRFLAADWQIAWSSYTSIDKNKEDRYGWKDFGPAVYAKDFEIALEYTNNDVWWDDTNDSTTDIVYSHEINESYCHEFDNLELKVNTAVEDKPISKSFVSDGGSYIKYLPYTWDPEVGTKNKVQEQNLIDMYYEHYSNPCKIYTMNIRYREAPYKRITLGSTISGEYVIDSQNFDLKKSNNEITLIEYKSDLS